MEEIRPGCYDVHARVKDMDAGGTLGSMCFASFTGYIGKIFLPTVDKEQAAALVRAYNDWHVDEWCGTYPGRFIPLVLPMIWDPALTAAEVRRNAEKGCHALSFSSNPYAQGLPSLYSDHWDPVWKACVDTKTVVCMHIGSSGTQVVTSPDAPPESIYTLSPVNLIEAATDVLWSPMLRKFPELRISLTEGGIGWIPYFLERVDYIYQHTRHWTGLDLGAQLPSDVFREHVITCFIEDMLGIETRGHMNIDNICWELDYPHADTQWPHAPEMVIKYLDGLPDDEIHKITHRNAMKHFEYDPFAHIPREQATVGALRQSRGRLGYQHPVDRPASSGGGRLHRVRPRPRLSSNG